MKYVLLLLAATTSAFAIEAAVPEIDGSSAVSAVALVAGGLLILRTRARK